MHSFECHSSLFLYHIPFEVFCITHTRMVSLYPRYFCHYTLYCIMNTIANLIVNCCCQLDHAFLSLTPRSWRHYNNVSSPILSRKRLQRLSCPVVSCPHVSPRHVAGGTNGPLHVTATLTVTGNFLSQLTCVHSLELRRLHFFGLMSISPVRLVKRRHLDDVMKWMRQSDREHESDEKSPCQRCYRLTGELTQVTCVVLCQLIIPQRCYECSLHWSWLLYNHTTL